MAAVVEVESPDTPQEEEMFNPLEHEALFPEECKTELTEAFTKQTYGYKRKATLVNRLVYHTRVTDEIKDALVEACTGKRTRKTTVQLQRDGLREFLAKLNDTLLQQVATEASVSFKSFMATGDKQGLIEAILDEMCAEKVG